MERADFSRWSPDLRVYTVTFAQCSCSDTHTPSTHTNTHRCTFEKSGVWYSRKCHGSLASGAHGTWLPTDTQTGDVPLGAWSCSLERTNLSSHMPKYMKTRNDRFDCSCRREDDAGFRHPPRSACPENSCPSAWQDHCQSVWDQGTQTTCFLINWCPQLSVGKHLL